MNTWQESGTATMFRNMVLAATVPGAWDSAIIRNHHIVIGVIRYTLVILLIVLAWTALAALLWMALTGHMKPQTRKWNGR